MSAATRKPRGHAVDRLLPQDRLAGPMPWVIAVMIFLTVIAAATGIALHQGAATMGRAVADRLTVQIVDADAERRDAAAGRIAAKLSSMAGVVRVAVVPRARLMKQLEPWLGSDLDAAQIPVPALIDVDFNGDNADIATIAAVARKLSPYAAVRPHAAYIAPVASLVRLIGWIAIGVVALMGFATACIVVLAARGAHASHRTTIDVLHMLGATDVQVIRMFQRRMTLDVGFGAVVGLGLALLLVALLIRSVALVAGDLARGIALPIWGWAMLPLLPCLFVALAWFAARLTLQRALGRSL